jgi:hypoxanthine phosphoribosyltransferase
MTGSEILFSRDEIAARVRELGRMISEDYTGRPLVLVGILNGAFIFLADLVREISLDLEVDFLRVASYGGSTDSSGTLRFSKDIELDIRGKDVLLVEDIIDTGRTMAALQEMLGARKAASVRSCILIDKRERREKEIAADYVGFVCQEGFLVGYGLDHAEQHRQHPEIRRIIQGA